MMMRWQQDDDETMTDKMIRRRWDDEMTMMRWRPTRQRWDNDWWDEDEIMTRWWLTRSRQDDNKMTTKYYA
jgi:hypothetical protein